MTTIERILAERNGTLEEEYGACVTRKLRARYSLSEELAIQRKREKEPEGFAAYDAFAEQCKKEARAEIYGEEANV